MIMEDNLPTLEKGSYFIVNQPFLYIIKNTNSGHLLFAGNYKNNNKKIKGTQRSEL